MILLHQHIAYPSPTLTQLIRLPSSCSAETCELAAIETSAITSKYLRYTEEMMVNAEFVFCAFTAARVLLGKLFVLECLRLTRRLISPVHSQYYRSHLNSEFFTLLQNLEEMSRRWRGYKAQVTSEHAGDIDLASVYGLQLRQYHSQLQRSHFDPGVSRMGITLSEIPIFGAATARSIFRPRLAC